MTLYERHASKVHINSTKKMVSIDAIKMAIHLDFMKNVQLTPLSIPYT